MQVWGVTETEATKLYAIEAAGHRSGVRAVALSEDGAMMLTAAETSVKIWNVSSRACLRHIDCNHGLSAMFAPGESLVQAAITLVS